MAALILPSRRVVQPQEAVDIDWSNPLAVGIRSAMLHGRIIRQGGSTPPESGSSPYGVPQVTRNGRALQIGTGASNAGYLLRAGDVGPAAATGYLALTETRLAVLQHRTNINYGISYSVPGGTTGGLRWRMLGTGKHQLSIPGVGTMGEGRVMAVGETAIIAMRARYVSGSFANGDAFTNGVFDGTGIYNGTIQGSAGGSIGGTSPATDPMREYGAMPLHVSWSRALSDAEIREVSANPWQLFRPLQRRIFVAAAGAAGSTGSISVTESGSDVASLASFLTATANLAATESGSDTAVFSAASRALGNLAATETGSDTAAIAGQTTTTGNLAATEVGSDTAAFSGGSPAAIGSMTAQEVGNDTAAISGIARATGTLTTQETGADTVSMACASVIAGSLAATEVGSDSFFATSGAQQSVGTLAAQEIGSDTASASGALAARGTLTATESGGDSAIMTGEARVMGLFAAIEAGQDVFSGTSIQLPARTGSMAATETGADGAAITGQALILGLFTAQEVGSDVFFASENDLTRIRPIQATYNTLAIDAGYNTTVIDPTYWID